jgi:hypothetical protein
METVSYLHRLKKIKRASRVAQAVRAPARVRPWVQNPSAVPPPAKKRRK